MKNSFVQLVKLGVGLGIVGVGFVVLVNFYIRSVAKPYVYSFAQNFRFGLRDKLASIKAFLEVSFNTKPHFLGEKIPITGDSKLSYD